MDAKEIRAHFERVRMRVVPGVFVGDIVRELNTLEDKLLDDARTAEQFAGPRLVTDSPGLRYEDTRHKAALLAVDRMIAAAASVANARHSVHESMSIAEITADAVSYANELTRRLLATDQFQDGGKG